MSKSRQFDKLYEYGDDGKLYYVKQTFESKRAGITQAKDVVSEPNATLYLSMLTSDAWANLTAGAIRLYPYMKMQAYSKTKNKYCKRKEDRLLGTEFYFNKALVKSAYPSLYANWSQFYKDKKCLIDNGFIKVVYGGSFHDRAVYDLSDKWQSVKRKKTRDMSKQLQARIEKGQIKKGVKNDTS